ncbi:MAG: hypothetical protein WC979_00955 [Candidatus Pacearchaeota archaeon]|jgi:hypothetical protein|nr:hypothetical protein [Clostridia bacterium]
MQAISLNKTGQYAVFSLNAPYKNIESIRTFTDDLSGVGTIIKQFRWSKDNTAWSYWSELTQQNLNDLKLNPANPFYIEYKYQLASQGFMTINNVQIEPNYQIQDPSSQIVFEENGCQNSQLACTSSGIDRASILSKCDTPTFNPYAVNPAINLYKDLSASISDLFGMEVLYMRAVPNNRSGDVILKEWTLYNVDEPVCSKVMVPDNKFPDDTMQYSMYGIGYEQPFEIEIVKQIFERDFGIDAAPQKNDIIFFPLVGNRLYEVQSSRPFKGFMMENTSWKCELVIYKPKSNRDMPDTVNDIMDDLMRSSDRLFGEETQNQIEDIAKPQQYDRKLGTNLQDPTRDYVNQDLVVMDNKIINRSVTVADHYYDLQSIFAPDKDVQAVTYKAVSNFINSQDFAFTTWFKYVKPKYTISEDSCKIMSRTGNTIIVTIGSLRKYPAGTLVQIKRQGRLNFYGVVVEVTNTNTFKVALNDEVINYLDTIAPTWVTTPGYGISRTFKNTFINGHTIDSNGAKGWKLESYVNRYFVYTNGSTPIMIPMNDTMEENKWYGLVFNHAAQFGQLNFSLWEVNNERTAKTELTSVFTRTFSNVNINAAEILPEDDEKQFELIASNHYQTNIRIFKNIIPYEQQSTILNQYIIEDGREAIVIDNSLPILHLPFVGSTK